MLLQIILTLLVGLLAVIAICLMFEYMECTILLVIIMIFGLIIRAIFGF